MCMSVAALTHVVVVVYAVFFGMTTPIACVSLGSGLLVYTSTYGATLTFLLESRIKMWSDSFGFKGDV